MIGVSFQPGANGESGQNGNGASRPTSGGVQEAIKILSLRLPRVVGAQSAVPMPLMTSQGSGGNPRVDAIVNQVMSRVGQPPAPRGPSMPVQGPTFGGTQRMAPQEQAPWSPPSGFTPRVVIDNPMSSPQRWPGQSGTDQQLSGGGQPPGSLEMLPPNFQAPSPGLPAPLPDVFAPFRRDDYQGSYESIPFEQPLF